jgi:integrase
LNCAFYPSEAADVQKSHIDLDAKVLVMDRSKTGVARIAVLWDRTVEAVREHLRAEPNASPYLFVSESGSSYDANHVGRNFRRRRAKAQLPDTVTFDMIRDGAYTAAVKGGASIDQARMLAGQRVSGVTDYYLKRDPRMVADACAAIEKHYFGSPDAEAEPASPPT